MLVSGGLGFASVSASSDHTCGVTFGRAAYCWGHNSDGRLGAEGTTESRVPLRVSGGLTFASVSAGSSHTCGVTAVGGAYCWGSNSFGKLGDAGWFNSSVPLQVSRGITFRSVDTGSAHTCGVASNGTGYCWGSNSNGKMGNGVDYFQPVPMPVLLPSPVLAGSTRPPNHESRSHLWEVSEWEDERFRDSSDYRDSVHEPIRPRRRR